MMRGSTLLLHATTHWYVMNLREATHSKPAPKRPSPLVDRRPCTTYRLAAIPDRLLLFIITGKCLFLCSEV